MGVDDEVKNVLEVQLSLPASGPPPPSPQTCETLFSKYEGNTTVESVGGVAIELRGVDLGAQQANGQLKDSSGAKNEEKVTVSDMDEVFDSLNLSLQQSSDQEEEEYSSADEEEEENTIPEVSTYDPFGLGLDFENDDDFDALPITEQLKLLNKRTKILADYDLHFYRNLAAKILRKLTTTDRDRGQGQSFRFRHLSGDQRSAVKEIALQKGYKKYHRFVKLAEEVTNTRNDDVHFNVSFDGQVKRATRDFKILFAGCLQVPHIKIISDILDAYEEFKPMFCK